MKKILNLITELNAPKNQKAVNQKTGKVIYTYRNCEDILLAVKPLMKKYGIVLNIRDEIVTVEDRFFVKATSRITDIENGESLDSVAYAELDVHQGMTKEQSIGTASSYARKYSLNGLLCIDDNKDPDTNEYREIADTEKKSTKGNTKAAKKQSTDDSDNPRSMLITFCKENNINMQAVADRFGLNGNSTNEQYEIALNSLIDEMNAK